MHNIICHKTRRSYWSYNRLILYRNIENVYKKKKTPLQCPKTAMAITNDNIIDIEPLKPIGYTRDPAEFVPRRDSGYLIYLYIYLPAAAEETPVWSGIVLYEVMNTTYSLKKCCDPPVFCSPCWLLQ